MMNTKQIKKLHQKKLPHSWCRRLIHYTGALLILYYFIPNEGNLFTLKIWGPPIIVGIIIIADLLRLKKNMNFPPDQLFRSYERSRIGSYVYFAMGAVLLYLFFPEQIGIPCILCASISDPIMGELRHRYTVKTGFIGGFIASFFLFTIIWYQQSIPMFIMLSTIGSLSVILAEYISGFWIDDDFLIQILPAIILFTLSIILSINSLLTPAPLISLYY